MIISWISSSLPFVFWLSAVPLHPVAYHAKAGAHAAGVKLLRRVLLQEERVRFEADQTIIVSSGSDSDATVTHEIHGIGRQVRLKYLLPKSAAGRLLVNDGKVRWEYDPSQRIAVRSRIYWRPATPETVARVIERLCSNYDVVAVPNAMEIEGRPMDVLRMTPRKADRNRQVWWIDRATGLVVKREVHDANGLLHFTSSFTNLRLSPRFTRDTLRFSPPKGVSIVRTREARVVTSIEQAHRAFPGWGRLKSGIGNGFHFESAREVVIKGKPGLAMQYTDGLIGFACVKVKGLVSLEERGKNARQIDLNGTTGTLTRRSRFAVLSWGRDGSSYSIVSDLSEALLTRLARSISTR